METNVEAGKTGANWRKSGKWGVGVVGALLVFFVWAYWYYTVNAPERDPKRFSTQAEWVLWGFGMKRAYVADTYGGDTPEETLNMYIAALEAGDVALAAKYYIPEDRDKVANELLQGKSNGTTSKYVDYLKGFLTSPETSTSTDGEKYWMSYPFGNDGTETSILLVRNKYSGKWKMFD